MTTTSTRERIVRAAAEAFQRQGFTGTGLKQISTESRAPFGSLYHFFPGGKEQLGAETIRTSGALYLQLIDMFFGPDVDIVDAVRNFFAGAAVTLAETDYADACPIATVALEVASTSEPLREATAEVFESWIAGGAAAFEAAGFDAATARELTIAMLSQLEGAFVLCRAMRTTVPLEIAGRVMAETVRLASGR
jgi:AcrR family transcriptional regulator